MLILSDDSELLEYNIYCLPKKNYDFEIYVDEDNKIEDYLNDLDFFKDTLKENNMKYNEKKVKKVF